jgi:hypothetical protein
MAANNLLLKEFVNFQGLDLRSSDLERKPVYASDLNNVEYRKTGAMSKRKGYQGKTLSSGGYGLATYSDLDTVTSKITQKLISIDENANLLREEELLLTYTGGDTAYIEIYLQGSSFWCDIFDNNILVLHQELGLGIDEASPYTLASLISEINGLANFSASATGITSRPAAFLQITRNKDISTATPIDYKYWEPIATPINAPIPFSGAQSNITDQEFENASFVNARNCLYISTGYDDLYKYDGVRLYKAGLPQASIDSVALGGAGAVTATNIQYKVVYEYTDAKGNFITGIESDLSAKISPSAQSVDITIDNILNSTGFDTDSTDLNIRLYRNRFEDSTTFYEVGVVTNDGTTATQIFNDNTAINSEGVEFIDPIKPHGLPPRGKYVTMHQGLLQVCGSINNPDTVFYSDIDSPEYFPPNDNSFLVNTFFGDKVTGISPLGNSLFVFKTRSIHQITGTMSEDIFRVDLYGSSRVGCSAHATIQEVNGFLLFLGEKGVYALGQNDQSLEEISEIVEPRFNDVRTTYNPKRATAIHWINNDKYAIHLPTTTDSHTTSSSVLVFDTFRKAWLEWSNFQADSFALKNGTLYFQERKFRALSGATETSLYQVQDTGDTWDYADHAASISFRFASHWESLEEPSQFKKFTRCKIHSLGLTQDDFESNAFKLDLKTELDYFNTTRTSALLDFAGTNGGWGLDFWGEFAWGATRLIAKKTKLKPMKCRSLRLILENNTLHENVLISGYEYEVVPAYKSFIKE